MSIRVYVGLEQINLTTPQRVALIAALRGLGKQADPQPSHINHWRPRLDGLAVIVEAEFDDSELTLSALKQWMANVFGIAPANIGNANTTNAYDLLIVLSYQGVDRLRLLLFGGAGAGYAQSHDAVLSYLAANSTAWE